MLRVSDLLRHARVCFASAALLASPLFAQWTTPVIDGSIGTNEYGSNNQLNNAGNTGQTWYMTWDATNLYVAITNANLSEGAVLYVGANPPTPPSGGTNANGNLSGFNYDGSNISSLPFRAQFVTYFKDGYDEYRTADGSGNWTGATATYGPYHSSSNGNVREFAIPWNAITGGNGLPGSFVFLGYLTSSGGYIYGQAPSDNPGGQTAGGGDTYTQYYLVNSTANGSSTPPFSNEQPAGFPGSVTVNFVHDTFNPFYRSPAGAVPEGTPVVLRFTTAHNDGIWGVMLRAYLFDTGTGITTGPVDTNMPFDQNVTVNSTELDAWKATITMPSATTIYYYKFEINRAGTTGWYSDDYADGYDNLNKDGTGITTNGEPFNSFAVNVYDPNFQTPAWLQNANVYHIFPDRFRNGDPTNDYCRPGATTGCPTFYASQQAFTYTNWNTQICDPRANGGPCAGEFGNQFYGGDLVGIQNELDYIQSLGMDAIYLNPVFQARSNHRYDTDNYLHIDPALGGDGAFAALTTEMNRRGMNVILDGVFNHASSDSLYFDRYNRYGGTAPNIGACLSLGSMWRSYFHFNDNNVPCQSADYPGWFGNDTLPTFDHTNPMVQNFFYSGTGDNVMLHWYNAGASGWRFDVADDGNFPHAWWKNTRIYAKGYNPNGPLIGEIWPDASQWLAGDQLDSVMNYRFRKNITGFVRNANWCDDNDNGTNCIVGLTPSQFDHAIHAVRDDYPPESTAAMLNLLDSHDVNRALYVMTELGDSGLTQAKQRLELAAIFQFTYMGAPMVMYGDEVALNSPSLANSANGPIGDPYTRAPYPWLDQPGDPTIYGPPDTTVESLYTKLAHMRKQYAVFRNGSFMTLLTGDTQQAGTAAGTYAFARTLNGVTAVIALNNTNTTDSASIPVTGLIADGTSLQDVISGATYSVTGGTVTITLAALSGAILLPYPASVDLVPPSAAITFALPPNAAGWFNSSPVNVNLGGTDSGGSGVAQLRYWVNSGMTNAFAGSSTTTQVAGEGLNTVYLRALDNASNISVLDSQTVNIDLHPPVVTITGVTNGATYLRGQVPAAGCSTTDALSGVAIQATAEVTGGSANGTGQFTVTCSGAVDVAGNVAPPVMAQYTVVASVFLATTALPPNGGSITPASGLYAKGSTVQVTATPAAGYQFAGFLGGLFGKANPQSLTLGHDAVVLATFAPLPPQLSASVGNRTDGRVAGTRVVTIALANSGPGAATNVTLTSITGITDISGRGLVQVIQGVPANLGSIPVGSSASTNITFLWPVTATQVRFQVNFRAGGAYTGSTVVTTPR